MSEFDARMSAYREAVEAYLNGCFTEDLPQKRLFEAMRYSLLAGGKRIRPVLALEFCRVCGGDWEQAVPIAAAVEMVHTYSPDPRRSAVHGQRRLPARQADKLTRCSGESTAVLAGDDALLTAAFETLANPARGGGGYCGTMKTPGRRGRRARHGGRAGARPRGRRRRRLTRSIFIHCRFEEPAR